MTSAKRSRSGTGSAKPEGSFASADDGDYRKGLIGWIQRNLPTRESIEANRWLRPIAHRVLAPELWRFTRRSVPRGVALGMFTGILVPMGQIPASAVLALPLRANIPAAALTTFITNPLTTPPLWVLAYYVGRAILGPKGEAALIANRSWADWLFQEAGPATLTGLLTLTVTFAILGYAATAIGWRLWIAHKWRRRVRKRV